MRSKSSEKTRTDLQNGVKKWRICRFWYLSALFLLISGYIYLRKSGLAPRFNFLPKNK
jgi:hypothetical protein